MFKNEYFTREQGIKKRGRYFCARKIKQWTSFSTTSSNGLVILLSFLFLKEIHSSIYLKRSKQFFEVSKQKQNPFMTFMYAMRLTVKWAKRASVRTWWKTFERTNRQKTTTTKTIFAVHSKLHSKMHPKGTYCRHNTYTLEWVELQFSVNISSNGFHWNMKCNLFFLEEEFCSVLTQTHIYYTKCRYLCVILWWKIITYGQKRC